MLLDSLNHHFLLRLSKVGIPCDQSQHILSAKEMQIQLMSSVKNHIIFYCWLSESGRIQSITSWNSVLLIFSPKIWHYLKAVQIHSHLFLLKLLKKWGRGVCVGGSGPRRTPLVQLNKKGRYLWPETGSLCLRMWTTGQEYLGWTSCLHSLPVWLWANYSVFLSLSFPHKE